MRWFFSVALAVALVALHAGCGKRETRVQYGTRHKILHLTRGGEPQELDPQIVIGQTENYIVLALFEGLVVEDPRDLHPIPGVAERWETSPDSLTYTFFLRRNARWSNGWPVTARDFLASYQRILTPSIASQYAYMLYVVKNAEAYNTGKLTNFTEVGFQAPDDYTLRITLGSPTPYFLSLINHMSWFPVHVPTIAQYGDPFNRSTVWTRPGRIVGNGPFVLTDWKVNYQVVMKKSPTYWDATNVHLQEIHFYAMENQDAEERAFRAGQLHVNFILPSTKIDRYQREHSKLLQIVPHLATYFYRFNVTKPPLRDRRVREALNIAIDRESLVRNVTRGGQLPASSVVPPGTAGYTSRTALSTNLARARQLLREAGFPEGQGFPPIQILYNTMEDHRLIAEAIQQMWKNNLGIDARLVNEEWKVYLDSMHQLKYDVARGGWVGDYVDPNTFLDCFVTDGGNNDTGWSNAEYDRLIKEAAHTRDPAERYEIFHRAEAILMTELPILPIYYYTRVYVQRPELRGWYPTLNDSHPYKFVDLDEHPPVAPPARPLASGLP
jgi:oligopeptide transport system substrate-binding protein